MLKYSHPNWFRETVKANHPLLDYAKINQVSDRLKDLTDDELKQHAANHPLRVVKVLSMYELNDRGVEGY